MKKTTLLALSLMLTATGAMADVTVPYGEGAGQADIINYVKYPHCDDPAPTGPLSFRVIGENVWVADSVRSKLMQFDKSGKFISEFGVFPKDEKTFFTEDVKNEKGEDIKLPVLLHTVDDFAPVFDKDGKVAAFWVVDSCKSSVVKVDLEGKKLDEITDPDFGQVSRIEIGKGGHIFIADKMAKAIFTFDADGSLLNKQAWDWNGFAVAGAEDNLYRLMYDNEAHKNVLVVSRVDGKTISGKLVAQDMFNPQVWWVDEEKGEVVVTYSPAEFKGTYNIVRINLDGKTVAAGEVTAAIPMNRFIDNNNGEVFVGKGNYFTAPEGAFEVVPFALPEPETK